MGCELSGGDLRSSECAGGREWDGERKENGGPRLEEGMAEPREVQRRWAVERGRFKQWHVGRGVMEGRDRSPKCSERVAG